MFVRDLLTSFLDFLYPPTCLSCSDLLTDRTELVCPACFGEVRPVRRDDDAFKEIHDLICSEGVLDGVYSPFWFDKKSPLQAVIHALKYQQIPQAGIMLGEAIGREIVRSGATVSYVVPVPLHKAKFREREYNQAEFVARGVVLQTGAKLAVDCVRRVVNTRTQTELTAVERRQNVEGAFELQSGGSSIQPDKPVLLVDDVLTTGATIRSVASLLRRAGHSKIYAGTIAIAARTQP